MEHQCQLLLLYIGCHRSPNPLDHHGELQQYLLHQPYFNILPPGTRAALAAQENIGWFPFLLLGWVSKQWIPIQQEFLSKSHIKITSQRWTTQLAEKMMMIAWDLWADRNDTKQ